MPENDIDDLMGIERPVTEEELAPDYDKYADEYYYEENEEIAEADSEVHENNDAFSAQVFNEGFFDENGDENHPEENGDGFTVNV